MPWSLRRAGPVNDHGRRQCRRLLRKKSPGFDGLCGSGICSGRYGAFRMPAVSGSGPCRAGERRAQFAGITHRGRAQHVDRICPVTSGQPVEPPENLRHMCAEYAPIGMGLIHHHMGQTCQKGRPLLVMGQDTQMQHFRVADEHRGRVAPDLAPEMVRGVAVIQGGGGAGVLGPCGGEGVKGRKLVLGQGLERKKIQGACVGVAQVAFQHGQVVNEALAAGRGRGCHNGVPGADMVCGQGLMAIEARDAALFKGTAYGRGPGQARGGIPGFGRRQQTVAGNLPTQFFRGQQGGDVRTHRHDTDTS